MGKPPKYKNERINPDYVTYLENSILQVKHTLKLVRKYLKQQNPDINPASLYLAVMKDHQKLTGD